MGARVRPDPATRFVPLAAVIFCVLAVAPVSAQKPPPTWERVGDGILISVVSPETFPPVNNPQFVPAAEAERFMKADEPVLGVFDGTVAKAYSLWHLDRHEVVNDATDNLGPIAVTW